MSGWQMQQFWVLVAEGDIHAQAGYDKPFAWGTFYSREAAERYRDMMIRTGAANRYLVVPLVKPVDWE